MDANAHEITDASDPMQQRIRARMWLASFSALGMLLVSQSIFLARFGRAYPVIAMPGFSGSGNYADGAVRTTRCDLVGITSDGTEKTLDIYALLAPLPANAIPNVLSFAFSPHPATYGSRVPSTTKHLIRLIFPGYLAARERAGSAESRKELRKWLADKVQAAYGDLNITALEFRWQQSSLPAAWSDAAPETMSSGTVVLDIATFSEDTRRD